jgi:hypothetical protein
MLSQVTRAAIIPQSASKSIPETMTGKDSLRRAVELKHETKGDL